MTARGRVLVVGDVMTDIIVVPEGPVATGTDRRATIRSRPGGSGANQAVWLGALGADVRFAARVGAADRRMYENYFRGHEVVPILAGDKELPSGVLVTIVAPDGERSFLTDRGANLNLSREDLPESLLDGLTLLLISGYSFFADKPRAAVLGLIESARARDVVVAVDPASVGFIREVGIENFLGWTQGASLLLANEDEAAALSGVSALEEQMSVLGQRFDAVVIKRGRFGAALGDRSGVLLEQPAPDVKAIDTTGAGDAFAAGFISALLRGEDEAACLKAGVASGARAVQQLGGQPG